MLSTERILSVAILLAIFFTLYYSRATYEVTVPGVKPFLTKNKVAQP